MELFFDTETTGLALFKMPHDHKGQPDIVQLGAILSDRERVYAKLSMLIYPGDVNSAWKITEDTMKVHGITNEMVNAAGVRTKEALRVFDQLVKAADRIVCHNVDFDKKMVQVAMLRAAEKAMLTEFTDKPSYCTMKQGTNLCKLPGPYGYKWPKLVELHKHLFGVGFEGAHDALEDVMATRRCYYEMTKPKVVAIPTEIKPMENADGTVPSR